MWPFDTRPEKKEHPAGQSFYFSSSASWSSNSDRRTYIREGYQLNVVVYRAIREVVEACKNIPLEVCRDEEVLQEHPVLELLAQPNPWQSYEQWLGEMITNRMLFGECFCVGAPDDNYVELWPLNPVDMEVKPGTRGLPKAYCHVKGRHEQYFEVDPITGESCVFFVKTYNPDNYWRGQSPLMAAALSVDTHNAGSTWNYSLLKNSARPSGLIRFKGGYPGGEAIQRMREYFKSSMSGERNSGEIPMLADDAEFVEMSKTPMDMDFINTMKEMSKYVSSALGVPLPLVDNDASTFNNLEQAKERLYTDTVIPTMQEFVGGLSAWLLPNYEEGLKFKLNLDGVSALEGVRKKKFDRAVEAYDKGVLTLQESRIMMGFSSDPEGELKEVSGQVETKADSFKPSQGMRSEARKGLDWRKEHNRGGTAVGVARARDIVNGKSLSADTVKRMNSFFARHEVDKRAEGFRPGEKGYPSAGRVAWALWGGDAGQSWAKAKARSLEGKDLADVLYQVAYGD